MKSKKITEPKISQEDIFEKFSFDWWNTKGKFKALHTYNFVRVDFIKKSLKRNSLDCLKNIKVLDIGCGGGILCEPLTRLGAEVTGIDTSKKAIRTARAHSKLGNLKIKYLNTDFLNFKSSQKYDVITAMEVLEHVEDLNLVINNIKKNLNKNGIFIGSTINKTLSSYIFAIWIAENIMKLVPKKTHNWKDFIKPNNLKKKLILNNFKNINFQGVIYNPLSNDWKMIDNCGVNYMFSAKLK